MLKTYDPGDISIIIGPHIVTGFADDSVVTVEREVDTFTKKVGIDGEVTRTRSRNRSGTITIRLMQSSASNEFLSNTIIADEESGASVLPILVKDANGTSLHKADQGWIKKPANGEFANEAGQREYMIDCAVLNMFNGSNNT
jgi:hypothetical protein